MPRGKPEAGDIMDCNVRKVCYNVCGYAIIKLFYRARKNSDYYFEGYAPLYALAPGYNAEEEPPPRKDDCVNYIR